MNKFLNAARWATGLFVAFMTSASFAQDVKAGSVEAGKSKAAMCIGCHGIVGYQASFPEIYRVPKISGQHAVYIAAALNAYKGGERKHPTMVAIATSLSEQDIADLAAFYAQDGGPAPQLPKEPARAPSAAVAELIKRGNCIACHGANFATSNAPNTPKLAGQHADYLFVALKAYKTEGNPKVGRANGVMSTQAKQFTNAELRAMSNYIASLPGDLKVVPQSRFR